MEPHGNWNICWQANLLIIDIMGNFNIEGVLALQNDVRKRVLDKGITRWQRLEIYHGNTLTTPEGVFAVKRAVKWAEQHGCTRLGVICDNPIQLSILEKFNIDNFFVFKGLKEAQYHLLN